MQPAGCEGPHSSLLQHTSCQGPTAPRQPSQLTPAPRHTRSLLLTLTASQPRICHTNLSAIPGVVSPQKLLTVSCPLHSPLAFLPPAPACRPPPSQVIDLGDDMQFKVLPAGASADKLVCSDPTIPHDDSNLVIKVRHQGGPKRWFLNRLWGWRWGAGGEDVTGI